jgi:poly(3-hydroxybutyrate) depolymerase
MRKLYFLLVSALAAGSINSSAQCLGGRYLNQIFPNVTMDSVVYSTPYNLKMDIYQPSGDVATARPVIILAHGGSFVSGNRRSDVTVDSLCVRFAKRGYVTVSIDYRLSDILSMVSTDSTLAIDEVVKAIGDGKAAIRYLVKDAATTNTYKIDTNNIFIGGNSAGAVLYMHVGYLDNIGECPSYLAAAMAANGGFEGNSGNDGYTTKSKAIINLAGGLNTTAMITPGEKPSVNASGTLDNVVPYTCAYPNFGTTSFPINVYVNLCGLGSLEPVYTAKGIYHVSHVFPGDGHVPWSSSVPKFITVDSLVRDFLYNQVCSGVSAVNEVVAAAEVNIFPNPATSYVQVQSGQAINSVLVYDQTGRAVVQVNDLNKENYELNTTALSKGVYFVKIKFSNENNTPIVKKIIIE